MTQDIEKTVKQVLERSRLPDIDAVHACLNCESFDYPKLVADMCTTFTKVAEEARQAGIEEAVEERKNLLRVIAWLIKENVGEQVDVEIPDYAILKDELDIPFSMSQRRSDKNNGWVVSIKRKCYVDKQSGIMVCWCGNCKQADYDLPVDYKKTMKAPQDNK